MLKCTNCGIDYEASDDGKLEGYCDYCIEVCKECGEQISPSINKDNHGFCMKCESKVQKTCYYCRFFGNGQNIIDDTCYLLENRISDIEKFIAEVGQKGKCSQWLKK